MKNILGTQEDLRLYNKAGNLVYKFTAKSNGSSYEYTYDKFGKLLTYKDSYDYSYEYTYDKNGNTLTYKNSDGYSYEYTYNENGKELTYKNSAGFSYEKTYDKNGNQLTFKNSDGFSWGFDIPEFTMEQLVEKMGNFKLIKKQ